MSENRRTEERSIDKDKLIPKSTHLQSYGSQLGQLSSSRSAKKKTTQRPILPPLNHSSYRSNIDWPLPYQRKPDFLYAAGNKEGSPPEDPDRWIKQRACEKDYGRIQYEMRLENEYIQHHGPLPDHLIFRTSHLYTSENKQRYRDKYGESDTYR